jgi:hypothetical protein
LSISALRRTTRLTHRWASVIAESNFICALSNDLGSPRDQLKQIGTVAGFIDSFDTLVKPFPIA